MRTHTIAVSSFLLAAGYLLCGSGTAVAAEQSTAESTSPQAKLEVAKREAEFLRNSLEHRQKILKRSLNPTKEDADEMIDQYRKIIKVREDQLERGWVPGAFRPFTPDERRSVMLLLELDRITLDHYMLARSKLDPTASLGLDLLGGRELNETKYTKRNMAWMDQIKAKLATKEQEIKALEGSLATSQSGPGIVPPVQGMTRADARAAIRAAQLNGFVKYAGARPSSNEEGDQMIVMSQEPAAGTQLTAGKGRVIVILAAKQPASDQPAEPIVELQPAPRDGRYTLSISGGMELCTMEWTNHADGSATLRIFAEPFSVSGAKMTAAGLKTDYRFPAGATRDRKSYIVGGKDLQDLCQKFAPPSTPDVQINNLRSDVLFVVTTEGDNVVLKLEGHVTWTETHRDYSEEQSRPQESITLIGTPIQ
jgi:hypothetical protein